MEKRFYMIEILVGGDEKINIFSKTFEQDPIMDNRVILTGVVNLKHPMGLDDSVFKVESWSLSKLLISNYYYGYLIDEDIDFIDTNISDEKKETEKEFENIELAPEVDEKQSRPTRHPGGIKAKMDKLKKFKESREKMAEDDFEQEDDFDWTFDV